MKIKSFEELKTEVKRVRAQGKKVVFTNGCFDILHPGHVRYLWNARQLGDHLVVAVNSDRSVRAIKGSSRPVFPEEARSEVVAALEFVDDVVLFDEETPLRLIEALLPDVLVKGGDWSAEKIIGSDAVRRSGGEVLVIPFVEGFSTTSIIEKILKSTG
ncbi:MAG: D-glycero-beta-D-manno-heptose 1-phosphate adenylyltransferase [Desulfobacteraceae bacterium]|nr:MAG: D-glycero-beta-D-manno-heptose 1-phosphate adenylyltransferase [Desulfobacteraceae bacterium]